MSYEVNFSAQFFRLLYKKVVEGCSTLALLMSPEHSLSFKNDRLHYTVLCFAGVFVKYCNERTFFSPNVPFSKINIEKPEPLVKRWGINQGVHSKGAALLNAVLQGLNRKKEQSPAHQ